VCGHRLDVLGPPAAGSRASTPAPAYQDPYLGVVLNNRFEVESKLGEGGFGSVYKGVQRGTGRSVALKLLHPEMTRDQNLLERFRREGMVLCNLKDAHTITTYDFDQTPEGTLYIAMELLEGRSLQDVFQRESPIDWRRMFTIVAQMCTSLAEAHAQGIVHRDLKPENIHLENRPGNSEFVKILDFGIAKMMQGDAFGGNKSPQLTATGQTLGTLEYMSPEQLMGKQLDGRSDVYALGVLSYELITGQLPFPDAKGPAQLITSQLKHTPVPPSQVRPAAGILPAVDACILRMLEKDKNNRFPDVTALRTELERILAGGSAIAAPPNGGGAPMAAPAMQRPATPQPVAPMMANPAMGNPAPRPAPARNPGPAGPSTAAAIAADRGSRAWLWIVIAIIAVGGGVGALLALS